MIWLVKSLLASVGGFVPFAFRCALFLGGVYLVKCLWQLWRNLGGKQ